jgi:hypothetical protein
MATCKLADLLEIKAGLRDAPLAKKGVWTLPTIYRLGALERDKF